MTNNDELAYREKHSRLWERYDEAAHDNAEHIRDILQLTLDALEAAEGHIFKTERDAKALLAERDADKKRIAEQQDIIAKQEKWIKDVETTMLAATDRAEAAEKLVAELERDVDAANARVDTKCAQLCNQDEEIEMLRLRIAELEARTVSVKLPDEFYTIADNIRTQDNRITSEPMFCVYQKREIAVDSDCDYDRIVWVDEDGNEASEHKSARLELLHDNFREPPDGWRRVAVKDVDDFVTCCFTERGCKDYLACNGHNLRLPFIYVKSGFRNAEYISIRNWLAGINWKWGRSDAK